MALGVTDNLQSIDLIQQSDSYMLVAPRSGYDYYQVLGNHQIAPPKTNSVPKASDSGQQAKQFLPQATSMAHIIIYLLIDLIRFI